MEASETGPPATPVQFEVLEQTPQNDYSRGAGELVWHITFKAPSGTIAHVDVPNADYTPENVARVIAEQVRKIEAVAGLTGHG